MTGTTKVALIGAGYWGPNFLRVASETENVEMKWCCDLDEQKLKLIKARSPAIKTTTSYREILDDSEVDAIILATPAKTHYKIAKDCLEKGKNILVEKPLTYSSAECEELIKIAEKHKKVLMVGHTFEYNTAVQKLKSLIDTGEVGEPYYLYSTRVNLGRIQEDINAMWSLAPHDVSMLIYLMGTMPESVIAVGEAYVQKDIEDVVFMTLKFPKKVIAQVHVSWLDPTKIRKLTLVGSEKMAVFDDVDNEAKLKIYDKGVSKINLNNVYGQYMLKLRAGEIRVPNLPMTEPLKNEFCHFIDCIRSNKKPISDGNSGLRVVKVLEAAQKSLKGGNAEVTIKRE